MERVIESGTRIFSSEPLAFLVKSAAFLLLSGAILYLLLGATYPPLHDTLHNFRHSLAIVPCH